MDGYWIEALNLVVRWAHMIFGIAWIGASFYFIWLDNALQAPKAADDAGKGVGGEVWSIHGGGIYHAQKYRLAPPRMPEELHWFKWEAYTTWISGMFLLAIVYYWGAELALIDPQVADLDKTHAILIGLAFVGGGWIVYDLLCRSPLGQDETVLSGILFVLVSAMAWGLCQLFSGRGAFIHFGAVLGTIMVGNVFFVIMPGQRALVKAAASGQPVDPIHGMRGKQRSVHNTFFTLPVLFAMISNHYSGLSAHRWNWVLLILLTVSGALIRLWFVQRHKGAGSPIVLAAGLLATVAALLFASPKGTDLVLGDPANRDVAQVAQIVAARCAGCHAAQPTMANLAAPPKGVMLETPAQMRAYGKQMLELSFHTRAMPPGNITGLSDEERRIIARWVQAGAPIR